MKERETATTAKHIRALWLAEMGCDAAEITKSIRCDPPTDPAKEQAELDALDRIHQLCGWERDA